MAYGLTSVLKGYRDDVASHPPSIVAIYEAVQSRQFAEAVKLSRQPDAAAFPVAVALGALAMSFLGRRDDALRQVRRLSMAGKADTDVKVLSIMAEVYSRYGMHTEKRRLYQVASEKAPDSEEILVELFFCYVQDEDYDKQKAIALKLFKGGRNAFGTWAATVSLCRRC